MSIKCSARRSNLSLHHRAILVLLLMAWFSSPASSLRCLRIVRTAVIARSISPLTLPAHSSSNRDPLASASSCNELPTTPISQARESVTRALGLVSKMAIAGSAAMMASPATSRAIGKRYELRNQRMVIQDIVLNVPSSQAEVAAIAALTQNSCKELRVETAGKGDAQTSTAVAGFGPDSYDSLASFHPGVSSFFADGGHATLSFRSPSTEVLQKLDEAGIAPAVDVGDGLQYIKISTETLRLSKGIEMGMKVKFAYGWVDLDSPSGVPLQAVVGTSRDPLMLVCLRVANLPRAVAWMQEKLGLQKQPFALARPSGSQFEVQQPEGSTYLSYGEDSMGILLVTTVQQSLAIAAATAGGSDNRLNRLLPRKFSTRPLREPTEGVAVKLGDMLQGIRIVYDDSGFNAANSNNNTNTISGSLEDSELPPLVQEALSTTRGLSEYEVKSPDGYPFILVPLSLHQKQAVTVAPETDPFV